MFCGLAIYVVFYRERSLRIKAVLATIMPVEFEARLYNFVYVLTSVRFLLGWFDNIIDIALRFLERGPILYYRLLIYNYFPICRYTAYIWYINLSQWTTLVNIELWSGIIFLFIDHKFWITTLELHHLISAISLGAIRVLSIRFLIG